ncbi:MAG: CaiB/BaiF CoA transferase family protein [Paracoccaceae bacterium]
MEKIKKKAPPLKGIKVLELARVLAGPWAGQLLADLGADVIKVESPIGDETRFWGATTDAEEDSSYFQATNRGKKSFIADFTKKEDLDAIYYIAKRADIIIENFKVGSLEKYGLDYESLRVKNSGLIYCSITGFGQNGPFASMPGYDFIIQAMGGIMDLTGDPFGPPMKPGVAYADLFTSLYSVVAIQSALLAKQKSEKGTFIDMSLFDTQLAVLANQASSFLISGKIPKRMGNSHPSIVPYQAFDAKDGLIVIACGNDNQFKALCDAFRWNFSSDKKFSTNQNRVLNRTELISEISHRLKLIGKDEITLLLQKAKVPVGSVNTVDQALNHPQALSRGMVKFVEGKAFVKTPIIFKDYDLNFEKASPELGANSEMIRMKIKTGEIWEN